MNTQSLPEKMKISKEEVVLVNEENEVLGTMDKYEAHSSHTPLHRGFSVFLFHPEKGLLLQQRSHKKKTWPLVWSNSCCGHPAKGEEVIAAAHRRLQFELGLTEADLIMVLPKYHYTCERDGIVENEICPVMVGFSKQEPKLNPEEVESVKWISWENWVNEVKNHPDDYSQWCVEETLLLEKSPQFQALRQSSLKEY